MRISYTQLAESLKKISGVSIPVFGIQWHPQESERSAARRVIAFCEDRRILYAPHNWEMKSESVQSATEIRRFLTDELGKLNRTSEFAHRLEDMRKACRLFLDSIRDSEVSTGRTWSEQMVHGAAREVLDTLRIDFGHQLSWIVVSHGLEIEEDVAQALTYTLRK